MKLTILLTFYICLCVGCGQTEVIDVVTDTYVVETEDITETQVFSETEQVTTEVSMTVVETLGRSTEAEETIKLVTTSLETTAAVEPVEPIIELSNNVYIKKTPIYGSDDYVVTRLYKYYAYEENIFPEELHSLDIETFFSDLSQFALDAQECGIPISAVMAQAYTEGGAGRFGIYTVSNNLFGIKASSIWDGMVYGKEQGNIYLSYHDALWDGNKNIFKVYEDIRASVDDYLYIISENERYKSALLKTPEDYLEEIIKCGYGESHMADVWIAILNIFNLKQYD